MITHLGWGMHLQALPPDLFSNGERPLPPAQNPLCCRGAQIIFVSSVDSWPQMDIPTENGSLGTNMHLKSVSGSGSGKYYSTSNMGERN